MIYFFFTLLAIIPAGGIGGLPLTAPCTQAMDVMDLKRSFQILEVRYGASEKEVRQAYRDMVSVWHPDRFSGNPRLQTRAEEKLKEANAAYETLRSFYHAGEGEADSSGMSREKTARSARMEQEKSGEVSRTELFVETGTEVVLTLWAHLSKKVGRILSEPGKRR